MTAITLEATTALFMDQYGLNAAHVSAPFTEFIEVHACDCCKEKPRKGVFIQIEGIRDTHDSLFKVCKECVQGF